MELGLTVDDHRNAEEAGRSGAGESETAGPSTPGSLPLHEEHAQQERRDVDGSHDERVDEDVAVQRSGVERQRVVHQTAREPVHAHTARSDVTESMHRTTALKAIHHAGHTHTRLTALCPGLPG